MLERFRNKPLEELLVPVRMYQSPDTFLPLSELLPEIKREKRFKRFSNTFLSGFSGFAIGCFGLATTYGLALTVPHTERFVVVAIAGAMVGFDQWSRAHGGISFLH